jgi:hypothetical protein
MAFPEKITNREYKIAGAFTLVIGAFFLAESLGLLKEKTPEPIALIALSALPVLFGLISLLTQPIRSVLILGPASLVVVFLTFIILDGSRYGLWESVRFQPVVGLVLILCIGRLVRFVHKKIWATPETDDDPPAPTPPEDE